MNWAILIAFVTILLAVLLVFQSIRDKVLYIKPFVGLAMFIVFGITLVALVKFPAVLGASAVPAILISALGMLVGLGWIFEGLDRPSLSKKGEK
jgi:hypothetical protein